MEALPGLDEAQANDLAAACRKAMKGFGTDEDALIKAICPLNSRQAQQLIRAFAETEKRDLVKDVKSECGGKFEDTLVAVLTPPDVFHATQIRKSIKGIGTNEELLIESVLLLSDSEIQAASKAYRKEFGDIMLDEIKGDLGGKLEALFVKVIESALAGRSNPDDDTLEEDVLRLYKAGEGKMGTDTKVFTEILGGRSPEYITERLAPAYAKAHGSSLLRAIKKEMGGDREKAFLALATPRHVYVSDAITKACKGLGSDTEAIVRLIAGPNRDWLLKDVSKHFLAQHDKSLGRWIASEESGDLKKALLAIIDAHE